MIQATLMYDSLEVRAENHQDVEELKSWIKAEDLSWDEYKHVWVVRNAASYTCLPYVARAFATRSLQPELF